MQAASRLKAEQVLVPSECAFCTFKRDYPWRNPEHPYEWSDGTVSRILKNEEYTGTQISCRTHKVSDKIGMVIPVPEEERYRVENTHEAIIGLETWEIVRRIRAHKRRPVKLGEAAVTPRSGMSVKRTSHRWRRNWRTRRRIFRE